VRDATQVDALIRHIEKTYGAVSVLVNNAGITRDNLSMRLKDDEWDAVLDTNLKAVFRLSRAVMRGMMKARHGRIINVTSVVGHAGNPGQANYCAAKAGVAGMSRALARELGSRNITVNCVAPGLIDTDMTRALDDKQKGVAAVAAFRSVAWLAAGSCGRGGFSGVGGGGLRHRHDDSRQRRHVHG
jgi:3-oxoacyl-[acyl-carrier protein] reductase